jgi:hypothetical protein
VSRKGGVVALRISSDRLNSILAVRKQVEEKMQGFVWLQDPYRYAAKINSHIKDFFQVVGGLEDKQDWEVLTPAAFIQYAEKRVGPMRHELLWRDCVNQANIYSALVSFKAESMLQSFVRAINIRELVSPSMIARGMLEHAATAYGNSVLMLSIFEQVGIQSRPAMIPEERMAALEETLVRSIWGTRLGRGVDSKKRPIWDSGPYRGNSMEATNILTHLQKLSASKDGLDHSVLKVYEWLSDVVHPASQGYRMFWDDMHCISEGHTKYTVLKQGGEDAEYINAIALWAAGYSTVILSNLLRRHNAAVAAMYRHLELAYAPYSGK